ncbi:odorant receptor 85b-like [Leptopilina heterotoma]|uniref:odorant receptor 85b-like n=1 Tax=Leptopilina heterotoma TaxID=63436 RepID=UPI001CA95577|nr:odorant receptor 85b-like [Leptopilina heterotoma]
MVNLCNDLWENVKEKEEAQAVKGYATIALYLTYGFAINVFFALIGLIIQPLFSQFVYDTNGTMIVSKQLPYSSGIFHENVRIFNIWFLLQIPAGLISIMPLIAIATAIPFFVFHACAHFKLLQYQISKLKSENSGHSVEDGKSRSTFKQIVGVVKQHQRVLNYAAAVEDVFSSVVLIQTVMSITAICAFGFNLLMVTSMNIAQCAYDSSWYNWTKRERKLIEIITLRSQRAAYLSAGKFSYMSLNAFSSVRIISVNITARKL